MTQAVKEYPKTYRNLLRVERSTRRGNSAYHAIEDVIGKPTVCSTDEYEILDAIVPHEPGYDGRWHRMNRCFPTDPKEVRSTIDAALSASLFNASVDDLPLLDDELPSTLSGLLRVAVEDARRLALDPRYKLDMNTWYEPANFSKNKTGRCLACMAGAVMVSRKKIPLDHVWEPWGTQSTPITNRIVITIDYMRRGDFNGAFNHLFQKTFTVLDVTAEMELALIRASATVQEKMSKGLLRAPWRTYLKAASILQGAGL